MGFYLPGAEGVASPGVAPDGLKGQVLAKASNLDFDTEWIDPEVPAAGHGGGGGGGTGAPALARRIDASAITTIYAGRAPAGTAESATGWTVTRTTFSALGALLPPPVTGSGAWANRASLTYS
jgi:hypothetical protein